MLDLFNMGGPLFMSLISIAHISLFVAIVLHIQGRNVLNLIKEAGLLALALGVLGQLIGLFEAFKAIEQMGGVSAAMLAGGLKVSSITTIYGLMGYILSKVYLLIRGN